jgi:CelD/BcsL family acetyltransferase involved in cellulose biosynthesis
MFALPPMPTLRIIDTIAEFRAADALWDDLWRRSGLANPTRRAPFFAQWFDHFAPRGAFRAVVVEDCGQFVAALPLVSNSLGRVLPVGGLPVNCWSSAGDLLLDASCDQDLVLTLLVEGIRGLPWPLLWFEPIEIDEPRWTALRSACQRAGLPVDCSYQFDLGLIDVGNDWNEYRDRWSKNLRHDMARRLRKAAKEGDLRLEVHSDPAADEVAPLLQCGFEVEDRSWKGPAGTSVLRSPGMLAFYVDQARRLAEMHELRLSFLKLKGWPIAFEYGYEAEGVHFSHKAGYDEAYRDFAPGQLLMMKLLERSHQEGAVRLHNCMGMLTPAVAKWCTRVRRMGRLVIGTGGPVGAASIFGYRKLRPLARRLRRALRPADGVQSGVAPGAAPAKDAVGADTPSSDFGAELCIGQNLR